MTPETRFWLLDLEAGRWADKPDEALEHLAREYVMRGGFDGLDEEVESLRDALADAEAELQDAEAELQSERAINADMRRRINGFRKLLKEAGDEL